jgi:hypothetical protein
MHTARMSVTETIPGPNVPRRLPFVPGVNTLKFGSAVVVVAAVEEGEAAAEAVAGSGCSAARPRSRR